MVTLALTAENRSLLAKVRKAEPEFTVEREELVASSPRKLFLERTNAYNERVKQQLKEKLAEKKLKIFPQKRDFPLEIRTFFCYTILAAWCGRLKWPL